MKKRTKTRPEHQVLKSMIGLGWGCRSEAGMWQHSKNYLQNQLFNKNRAIYKPSNTLLDKHLAGECIVYGAPMFSNRCNVIITCIDTDMKITDQGEFRGDPDDVPVWNAEVANLISGAESFPSPSFFGSHTHFGLCAGKKYGFLNNYDKNYYGRMKLRQFGKAINNYAINRGYKLTKVEIKGTPALIDYHAEAVSCGELVALPRETEHISYVSNRLPVLTFAQLEELTNNLEKFNKKFLRAEELINKPVKPKSNDSGSPVVKIVTPESYGDFVNAILAEPVRSRDSRYVCNANDFSDFISVIHGINGADIAKYGELKHMAFSRIEAVWNAAYESGDLSVRFCNRKVTAMRDALSKAGFIEWIDHEYAGGKACVWRISKQFFQLFAMFQEPNNTHTPTCSVNTGDSKHYLPVFDGTKCPNIVKSKSWMELEQEVYDLCC